MKYGPTSAASNARINAIAKPSNVVCTPLSTQELEKNPRLRKQNPTAGRVSHDIPDRTSSGFVFAKSPFAARCIVTLALFDGKSVSPDATCCLFAVIPGRERSRNDI